MVVVTNHDMDSRLPATNFLSVPEAELETKAETETGTETEQDALPRSISCTTFNILAPIYKRLDPLNQALRESEFKAFWLDRNQRILDWLLYEASSIICLQEFWVGNEELVRMYSERLHDAGYTTFKLGRTNNRGDGLLTAVHKDYFSVQHHRELLFNDFGDRVAQLLHLQLKVPIWQNPRDNFEREFLVVNTHLLFPHDSSLCIVRLQQVYKILQYLESYQKENQLNSIPIMLCGDWNGSKRGHVYKFLRSQGFESTYDTVHDIDAHKWVSHRNHRGNICGVDFIWLRNPNTSRKPLKTSWGEAVFSILKYQLRKASMTEHDAFAFLKGDNCGDFITYSAFIEALRQVNLIGVPSGLSFQETRDLWIQADTDGNGVVDYEEFKQGIWNAMLLEREEQGEDYNGNLDSSKQSSEEGAYLGFKVKSAALFPREVEKGLWPEHYSLSDHARLTVVLSPAKMQSSQSRRHSSRAN